MKFKSVYFVLLLFLLLELVPKQSNAQIEPRVEVGVGFPNLLHFGIGAKLKNQVYKVHYGSFFGLLEQDDPEGGGEPSALHFEGSYFLKNRNRGYHGWDCSLFFDDRLVVPFFGYHLGRECHLNEDKLILNGSIGLVTSTASNDSQYTSFPIVVPSFNISMVMPINVK